MNQERRTETEHLVSEVRELAVECQLAEEKGSAKYTTTDAWLRAGGELSDKISDLLTEEQDAAASGEETSRRKERDHADLLSTSAHLEEALEDMNDAVDALGEADYAAAGRQLDAVLDALNRAMG
ncbi:MAG: hypothetical protein HDQ87_08710 [Clostridia bacterium]|nr:hypothetical protein [Clostridia bacterium]